MTYKTVYWDTESQSQQERDCTPEEVAEIEARKAAAAVPTQAYYADAMTLLFDTTAKSRNYDNRITCALRAGYVGPFQAEGIAFGQWMDACNALGYTVLAEVMQGQRAQPTVAEFMELLPTMEWPT